MKLRRLLENKLPRYFYHATYKELIPSIKKKGLTSTIAKKSWSFSGNYVYLSGDEFAAESYAEIADNVPEEWVDNIVVLEIPSKVLDPNKLDIDENNKSRDTWQYAGAIPWKYIRIKILREE